MFEDVAIGTYEVREAPDSEQIPANDGLTCTFPAPEPNCEQHRDDHPADQNDAGNDFGNIPRGQVIVEKQTTPDGDSQAFTFDPGPGLSPTTNFALTDGGQKAFQVAPGTYSVAELAEPGWDLASINCTDPTANSAATRAPASRASTSPPARRSPASSTTAATAGSWSKSRPPPTARPTCSSSTRRPAWAPRPTSTSPTVRATASTSTRAPTRSPRSPSPAGTSPASTALIDRQLEWQHGHRRRDLQRRRRRDVTCTFNNSQDATLTIVKQATPEGTTSFDFDGTGTGVAADIDLVDDGAGPGDNDADFTFDSTQLGTKTVTENVPAGWTLDSAAARRTRHRLGRSTTASRSTSPPATTSPAPSTTRRTPS